MEQYTVRSGQNIYDVALTLHGTVEGVFDLLVSNEGLNMESVLERGMVLNYHKDFVVNQSVVTWLRENGVLVKNGEHIYERFDIEAFIKQHIYSYHAEEYDSLQWLSPDERNMYWESLTMPRMVIAQEGVLSGISVLMKTADGVGGNGGSGNGSGKSMHMVVDWGDYSEPEIVEGDEEVEVEHCYKSGGAHKITLYGNFACHFLDLSAVNGVYYPLGKIYTDMFLTAPQSGAGQDALIITE